MNYLEIIEKWKINHSELARKLEIPVGTFNNKLSQSQNIYNFTPLEEEKIKSILRELATDILGIQVTEPYKMDFNTKQPITKKILVTEKVTDKPIIKELDKEGSKPYKPKEENPRFKIVNGKRVFSK